MTDQEMLQKLKAELDQLLGRYNKTKDLNDLRKANELRRQFAQLDVKLHGGKR